MKTIKINSISVLLFIVISALVSCSGSDEDPQKNTMTIVSITPESPATLKFNEFVLIRYEYNITSADGARMWVIPQTNGAKSPESIYSSSKVYTGAGKREVGVSIDDSNQPVIVDQLKVTMSDPDQNDTLFEKFIDVEYTFEE